MKQEKKNVNEIIIDEALNQYKEGKMKTAKDIENFLDSHLEPLMQKLLDVHHDYARNFLIYT